MPIIFPDKLVHSEVSEVMMITLRRHFPKATIEAKSAGSVDIGDVSVSGDSETMQLESNPTDARMIENYTYLHGVE
jgi:hypothetical protein